MSDIITNEFMRGIAAKEIDWDSDVHKVALLNSGYIPDRDHTSYANISGYEIANGNGYTTGGVTVSGTIIKDNALDKVFYDLSDPSWTASGGDLGPARYAGLYDTSSSNALCYIFDFNTDQTADNGADFKIIINSSGLMSSYQM